MKTLFKQDEDLFYFAVWSILSLSAVLWTFIEASVAARYFYPNTEQLYLRAEVVTAFAIAIISWRGYVLTKKVA